jgi:hypothetical protein
VSKSKGRLAANPAVKVIGMVKRIAACPLRKSGPPPMTAYARVRGGSEYLVAWVITLISRLALMCYAALQSADPAPRPMRRPSDTVLGGRTS